MRAPVPYQLTASPALTLAAESRGQEPAQIHAKYLVKILTQSSVTREHAASGATPPRLLTQTRIVSAASLCEGIMPSLSAEKAAAAVSGGRAAGGGVVSLKHQVVVSPGMWRLDTVARASNEVSQRYHDHGGPTSAFTFKTLC